MKVKILDISEDHLLTTADQIQIDPLSKDDALKFHHETESQNSPSIVKYEPENSGDSDNFEMEFLEEETNPELVIFFHSFIIFSIYCFTFGKYI